ncbi:TrbC/VirB2 family protein [Rhizobium leguminosarum]|uniref:TrbC/VirB2 family protein n=1 Tax=Rhizobium leguminosarum TaxID=384 RepID=UPI001C968927|nr:TrbC/VirB2 family protein [Rhizobium leguminosarum]MBY5775222.1 TrbC/VirB2 family protein [Rhizobium leguminosarum]
MQFRLNSNQHRALRILATAALMTLALASPSAAQDFGGVSSFLEEIVGAITGPIGIAISALAVMAVGFSFMTGRMDWTFAVSIVLGIAIVFGAASFVEGITAS